MRRVASFLLLVLLTGSALAGNLKVGDVPPGSLGRDESGARVRLEDYRGKVVIITFWASWCPPCRKELPILAGVQKQATTARLQVLAVNSREDYRRYRDIVRVLRPALKESPLKLISDADGYYDGLYGVKGIPHMVLIGRDGRIAAVHEGYGESALEGLIREINELLAAEAAPGGT